ncbi:hypothetical protein OROHE_007263 [Orobanche hederae]
MAIESASPSYWPNESPESTKLSPILNESTDLTSLSSIQDSTSLSLQPSLESLESNESGESSPYSQPWSPDVQAQSVGVICSYSPNERIYSDDSLDSELPWGDVVPDTLDSEGGYLDYCVPESITTDSISQGDGIDEAYLKALGQSCPDVLNLLDKNLMQEPFCSVPLIWIIQEDSLANRLQLYQTRGWDSLISNWKNSFSRDNAVVFPEFSFPMLYGMLDTGNYFVIPGSPIEFWAAERYSKTHSKFQPRKESAWVMLWHCMILDICSSNTRD